MPYGWLITKDHVCNGEDDGVMGPRNISDELAALLRKGEGQEFRLYDDDDELYYAGKLIGDYDGLEPLDDWGYPNAGATYIMMKDENNDWKQV
jgi:hypothetical protein